MLRLLAVLVVVLLWCPLAFGNEFRVLAVMSYEKDYPWVKAISKGIRKVLAADCELRFFYLDTKKNLQSGPEKARQAYQLFQSWRPDGVIAADDNAQVLFVVPYLRNQVETPVMFCGVNAEPEQYGYPAANVSGILERLHIRESIAFALQLAPTIRSVGYIFKESPVADLIAAQIEAEKESYPARSVAIKRPATLEQALRMTRELRQRCDLLFVETLEGVLDDNGRPMRSQDIIPRIVRTFGKPTIGADEHAVRYGVLCSVIKSGEEQGRVAASKLLAAMRGTPVTEIPITRNHLGKRMLNVTSMRQLGIHPQPIVLRGVQLVKTEP